MINLMQPIQDDPTKKEYLKNVPDPKAQYNVEDANINAIYPQNNEFSAMQANVNPVQPNPNVNYTDKTPDGTSDVQAVDSPGVEQEGVKIDKGAPYGGLLLPNRPTAQEYNSKNENMLRATAKATAFGNALALLADTAGTTIGGTVQRRASKPLEPYMQQIMNRRDQYEKDQGQFKQQDFLNQLGLIKEQTRRAENQAAVTKADERYKDAQEFQGKKFDAEQDYRKYLKEKGIEDSKTAKKQWGLEFKEKKRATGVEEDQKWEQLRISDDANKARLAKQAADLKYRNKNLVLFNPDGSEYGQLSDGQREAVLPFILNDPDLRKEANDDIELLKAQFGEGLGKTGQEYLVAKYWHRSPQAVEFLKNSPEEIKEKSRKETFFQMFKNTGSADKAKSASEGSISTGGRY